ncbi:MAG: hypothetical protein H7Z14_19390 [Anaerolineae bacterium]|nr:hypothetical protein [Phycisphaerae bacterium]
MHGAGLENTRLYQYCGRCAGRARDAQRKAFAIQKRDIFFGMCSRVLRARSARRAAQSAIEFTCFSIDSPSAAWEAAHGYTGKRPSMRHTDKTRHHLFVIALIAQSLLIVSATSAQQWTTIARSNQPAPGLPQGSLFAGGFGQPSIDSMGRITFTSTMHNAPFTSALWATGPNGSDLSVALYDNQPVPGESNLQFRISFLTPHLSEGGGILASAKLSAGTLGDAGSGILAITPSDVRLLARSGQPAPGVNGGVFAPDLYNAKLIGSADKLAFLGAARIGNLGYPGIWGATVGSQPKLLVVANTPAPGSSQLFATFDLNGMTDEGEIGFRSETSAGRHDLWIGRPGNYRSVLSNVTQDQTLHARLTPSGSWVLPGVNDSSITRMRPSGQMTTLATAHVQAPGLPPGVAVNRFALHASASRTADVVAFAATLEGSGVNSSNNSAAFISEYDQLKLIAREGEPAPGTGLGQLFDQDPVVFTNAGGQIVLISRLRGQDVHPLNNAGVWFDPGNGQLQLALRTGDQFNDNGMMRTVQRITPGLLRVDDGMTFLNDQGQFIVHVEFNNGTGIYRLQVPEPSAAAIGLICVASLLGRRRT